MPDSRPADYYLGCLDGCIFMDFDNCENERIRLKRISFDGYGCCDLGEKAIPMNNSDSKAFKQIIDAQISNEPQLTKIIKSTILNNIDIIWKDALNEYGLV
jgi:hypothetical protein